MAGSSARAASSGGEHHRVAPALLGEKPRLPRGELGDAVADHGEVGARCHGVEAHEHGAGLHRVAVAHQKLAHHAAGGMLDLLDPAVHHELARREHRAREVRRGGPAA
jgi:hypothetical protein